jgi:hypothetical protein
MRPQQRQNWERDDYELDDEFKDISKLVREHHSTPPKVPRRLDRLIRKYASQNSGTDLQNNWLLGPGLQLAMVILLFFVIGLMFVSSLELATKSSEPQEKTSIYREQ